jgi:hypothetical protein
LTALAPLQQTGSASPLTNIVDFFVFDFLFIGSEIVNDNGPGLDLQS